MSTMRRPISRLSLLASSLTLAACATTERPVALVPPTQAPVEVQILGLNDFHGNLETQADPVPLTGVDGGITIN